MRKLDPQGLHDRRDALAAAEKVVAAIGPHCEQVEIAGSLRRGLPRVHDIDIVLQPQDGQELLVMAALGMLTEIPLKMTPRIWKSQVDGVPVDLYLAGPEQFATLLLIRTGSAQHNVYLASRARAMGMQLKASGDGLFYGEERVAWRSEEEIFEALGLPFKEPKDREKGW